MKFIIVDTEGFSVMLKAHQATEIVAKIKIRFKDMYSAAADNNLLRTSIYLWLSSLPLPVYLVV